MSVTSSRWSAANSSMNRYKATSSKSKSSLLGENVKNYPHRESLVKKSSPYKSSNNTGFNLATSSLDSNQVNKTLKNFPRGSTYASSELLSELSQLDSPSKTGTVLTTATTTTTNKPTGKRGSLLGPFKFMTSELEDHKLQHYNKGHLETVLKQLDLLQCLLVTKFQEERHENETQVMKAWMAVNEKEEEAFTISIKSRTVEEVHKIHHRLVEMEKNMEKVCESLAPTFEKFASFNELKVAQKETENYVKSIKKFNVRTKINQEYSERILKLEKSIDFLERTNEKSNRMVRTPIIEQAKRIDSAVFQRPASPTDSVTSSGSYKKLNHSQSWTNNKAMEALSSKSNDSTEREKAAGIALELEVPPKSENTTTAGNSVVKSPPGKPPIPFHERVSRPSWIKEKTEETTSSEAPNVIVLSSPGKLSSRHTSWIKDKDSLSAEDANHSSTSTSNASVTSISSNSTSTSISSGTSHVLSEPASSASTVVPDDLAAVAMGITATSSEVVVETKAPATPSKADVHLISSTETTLVEKKVVEINGSNSSSVAGSPSGAGKKSTVTEDGPNLSTISKTEKVVVEKKVLSRASWIKKEGEDATNSLPPLPATPNSSVKPLPFPDAVSSLSHSNSTSEADNANKLNRSIYVPKPDSKLAPPAEIPPSTVVKSIVSQINVSKTLNSSFYEKKLQQSGSPTNRSGQNLPKILEGSSKSGDDLNLTPAIELKSEHKKSWKELAEPLQLPVPPPVAPIIPASTAAIAILAAEEGSNNNSRSNSRGYHRRTPSNGSSSSSKYSPVDSVLVLESTMSSQPHPEASKSLPAKNDFGAKSWREFSKSQSNSNETAQISTYEAANGQKKEEGIAIRAASNYSTGLSAERLPTPNSAGPTSAFTRRPSFSTNKDEGANVSGKFNTSTGSSPTTPRFQPKLSTNFMDVKTSPSGSPTAAPAVTTQSNPSTIGGPSAFAAGTPPRITGSRGLISAISLNRQKAEATAGSSITNTGPSELPPTSRTFTTINTTSAAQADKKVIPTRNSLDLKVTDSQYKASPTTTSQAHVGKEFELEMENVPTEIMSRPPKSGPTSPRHSNTSTPGPNVPSGASASNDEMETGSAMSGVTIESASGKKKRLTVKGMVKRVNSLFRTASSAKVEEPVVTTTTTTITEQNLTKQQMAYVQEKRQSFIEKKIDADTTIVTNTPVIKANQPSVDNDFSFIEHLGADVKDDDLSSIDHQSSMDHQSEEQQKMEQQVIMSETSSQQPSSSSAATGKSSKSISKRISGLVKKTSSIFSKFTGAPEPPPRPENLPPANSASTSSHQAVGTASGKPPAGPSGSKKVGGIAMSPSDSFDVPAMTHLREMEKNDPLNPNRPPSMEVRPILKNGPNRIDSERSLPVETSSLGTIDKIIQQQQGTAVVDEESSLTTDDKFDVNGAPKPKKFKPVKFFKKTFTSMSKMI